MKNKQVKQAKCKKCKAGIDLGLSPYENHQKQRDAIFAFVKEIASEPCYQISGEYPEPGEDGHAPCRSCQARDAIAQAEQGG